MDYTKQPLDYPRIFQMLKGRGLIIRDDNDASKTATTKLYAQLCCLAYLQDATHPGNDFKQQLKSLLQAHPNVDVTAMGFPKDWRSEPLWR